MKKRNEYNLIELFRNYYKSGIPNFIGTTANSIFLGLLYKFNEMGFPESLKISNREMLHLSGIVDIRTFRNARTILANYLHNDSQPESYLIKVEINDIREYTIYYINYVTLQENYCNITVKLQESYSNITGKLQESYREISEIEKDRGEISTDLRTEPAKNALLSNTIQYNTILDHTIQDQINPNIGPTDPNSLTKNDSMISEVKNNENKGSPSIDEKGEYISVWDANFGEKKKKGKAIPRNNSELDDFNYVLGHDRQTQLILIKRWDREKQARFYDYVNENLH